MPQFHETGYGRKFFDGQLPELIKQLTRIADALEKQNVQECEAPIKHVIDDFPKVVSRKYLVHYETANESGKAAEVTFPVIETIPVDHAYAEYECARILEIPHNYIQHVRFISEEEN